MYLKHFHQLEKIAHHSYFVLQQYFSQFLKSLGQFEAKVSGSAWIMKLETILHMFCVTGTNLTGGVGGHSCSSEIAALIRVCHLLAKPRYPMCDFILLHSYHNGPVSPPPHPPPGRGQRWPGPLRGHRF